MRVPPLSLCVYLSLCPSLCLFASASVFRSHLTLTSHLLTASPTHLSFDPKCLSVQAVRRAVPYVGDSTLLQHVHLRRRLSAPEVHAHEDVSTAPQVQHIVPLVCMRVKLPAAFYSVGEIVERLCKLVGAYVRQVRVIVCACVPTSLSLSLSLPPRSSWSNI